MMGSMEVLFWNRFIKIVVFLDDKAIFTVVEYLLWTIFLCLPLSISNPKGYTFI